MTYDTINDAMTMQGGTQGALLAGRYRVVRQLGQGGMGSVWLAEDTQLDNKPFAIKMLPSILVSNKRAYRQLKDEALVAMQLVHPNIVQIRAFEENNGNPFLVMDYVDGQTLDDYLADYDSRVECAERVDAVGLRIPRDRDGRAASTKPPSDGLPEDEVIRLLTPIAAALDYAHSKGVVHRDVKPGNVMIAKDGTPYILDFGIAREIQETMTRVTGKLSSGTLLYMSPEQLNGEPPKPAQDVYSFAAMVYECLKGEPPFSRGQIEFQILNNPPPPLNPHIAISGLVMQGLAKKPVSRPKTCAAVLKGSGFSRVSTYAGAAVDKELIERVGGNNLSHKEHKEYKEVGRRDPSPPGGSCLSRPPKRKISGIALPIICIVAALLVLGGVFWHRGQQRKQAERRRIVAAQKAEVEARQRAEDERRAREESDRKKVEAERLAKAEAEAKRLAEAKAEAERKAKEEARRIEEEKKAREQELARQREEARKADEEEMLRGNELLEQKRRAALQKILNNPLQYENVIEDLTERQRLKLTPIYDNLDSAGKRLRQLLTAYTESHPDVIAMRKRVDGLTAEFKEQVESFTGGVGEINQTKALPTAEVYASINGERVDGAVLNDGKKDYILPLKWTLTKGKKYGPYRVSLQRNGLCYDGTFEQVSADWNGVKAVAVELRQAGGKKHEEILPFWFKEYRCIPNGRFRFSLVSENEKDDYGRRGRTYSVLIGEEIGKTGFVVVGFKPQMKSKDIPGLNSAFKVTVDDSVLEIKRLSDGCRIGLPLGKRNICVPMVKCATGGATEGMRRTVKVGDYPDAVDEGFVDISDGFIGDKAVQVSLREYGDFILRFEYKLVANFVGGIEVRTPSYPETPHDAIKGWPNYDGMCSIPLVDDGGDDLYDVVNRHDRLKAYQYTGSIYGISSAKRDGIGKQLSWKEKNFAGGGSYSRKAGEWNFMEVKVVGSNIDVFLNGQQINRCDLSAWGANGTTPDGRAHPGLSRRHGHLRVVRFTEDRLKLRNVRILELPDNTMADCGTLHLSKDEPLGFERYFAGRESDLRMWKGVTTTDKFDNPIIRQAASPAKREEIQRIADDAMRQHWSVRNGSLFFDGLKGGYSIATLRDYADFEMWADWRIMSSGADAGLYLRGSPQVQIWDAYQRGEGSGGLFNNKKNQNKALKVADRPIGDWNRFHIVMKGSKVKVWLNGELVVDNVTMENYWDRRREIFSSEQIELQCHGDPIEWRNIFIKRL